MYGPGCAVAVTDQVHNISEYPSRCLGQGGLRWSKSGCRVRLHENTCWQYRDSARSDWATIDLADSRFRKFFASRRRMQIPAARGRSTTGDRSLRTILGGSPRNDCTRAQQASGRSLVEPIALNNFNR